MATIITRSGKGSPLTNNEVDANFTNLNSAKIESGDTVASLTISNADINGGDIASAVTVNKSPQLTLTGDVTGTVTFTNLGSGSMTTTASADLLRVDGDGSDLQNVRAETLEVTVKNVSGGALAKGTPVHQTGTSGAATFEVVAADASNAAVMPAHFVLLETLADGAEGRAVLMGRISGVDTSGFSEGDTIYVAAGGGYTNVAPTGEGNLVQNLGTVTNVDATNGGGEVMGAGRAAATPNLNQGNIFLGNASNQAATASLSTSVSSLSHYNNSDWDTAFSWGDHSLEGYLTGNQTITLSGDVSGSGTTSIVVTVADDSHNHVISNVDGLQTALNAKQDASTALTTSTTFGGDVSGTYNAIVIADDSHNHVISNVDGLQAALDTKYESGDSISVANITATGYLRGPSTFTIDPAAHGDNTGTVVIAGNLQIDGTTTTVNSTTVTIDDLNLTLASGAATAAAANGAGITIDGASATILYNSAGDEWQLNKPLTISGNTAFHDGYHPNADKWTTARTLSLTGAVTGSVSIDGSGNVSLATTATSDPTLTLAGDASGTATFTNLGNATLTVTVADDSHNHIIGNVDGLQAALDAKQAASTALTTSTTFGGDVSGTYNAIVVADDSHNHIISNVDGLQAALDAKQAASTALTTSTTFGGDVSGTYNAIVIANDSHTHDGRYYTEAESDARFVNLTGSTMTGTLKITGDNSLIIDSGNTTYDFIKLTYNDGDTVGFNFRYTGAGTGNDNAFEILSSTNKALTIKQDGIVQLTQSGASIAGNTIFHDGYHPNADKWTTARTLSLTGAVTGSASIDGSGNVSLATTNTADPTLTLAGDASGSATFTNLGNATLTVTVADDSHNHVISNVDGLQTALDAKLNLSGGTLTGDLNAGDNDLVAIGRLNFNNHEGTDYGVAGDVMFDENFFADPEYGDSWSGGNGGGLAVYNEDGWGRILTDRNVQWLTATFNGLKVGSNTVFHDGYHPNADKWTTARTLSLTGAVTGSASIDGSGNVSLATTATSDPTLTLNGDVSGSATFTNLGNATLTVTVADDSHNHVISNVDGLQTALDAKQDSSTALTTSTTFGGDVSGTYNAIVVADDSHNHVISNVDGLQTALDGKFDKSGGTITGNVTLSGADGENALTLSGASPTMAFTDTTSSADDFYIHINSNNFYILADRGAVGSYSAWDSPHPLQLEADTNIGYLFGDRIFDDGYHPNADKWTTSRTLTLNGDVSGSVSWDGSANATLTATVADDSHNHIISNVDGLQAALDGKLGSTANAVSASKWATARTVSLTGAVTGSASVDGSANVSIATTHTADPTLTLTGDVTGSATFTNLGNATLTATVANDSHNHAFNNLTGKTSGTGDYKTDGNLVAGSGSGSIALTVNDSAGNANLTFNHENGVPDTTGNAARVEVNVDSSTGAAMYFELKSGVTGGTGVDLNNIMTLTESAITAESGIAFTGSGSGLTGTASSLSIGGNAATASKWATARTLSLTGAVTGSASIDGSGNVSLATTNTADPTLTLNGDVSGSATFTNLGNATLTVTVADDSHNHVISNVDGLQTALDGKQAAASELTWIDQATGDYGTVKVDDDRGVTWAGYAIRDDWVFMSNGTDSGIYNDTDNEWGIKFIRNSSTDLYFNGTEQASTQSGYFLANNQMRSPIFYDSNNTTYYTNPASTSVMNDIQLVGEILHYGDTNTYLQFHAADQFRVVTGGSERLEVNNTYVIAQNQMRAPIYYDSGNTAYYADPAATSVLNRVLQRFPILSANTTLSAGDQVICTAAITITLPASPSAGDHVVIANKGTGTVTVGRNGQNIESTADNGSLDAGSSTQLVYVNSTIGWGEI